MRTWDVSRDGVWPGECDDGNGREGVKSLRCGLRRPAWEAGMERVESLVGQTPPSSLGYSRVTDEAPCSRATAHQDGAHGVPLLSFSH